MLNNLLSVPPEAIESRHGQEIRLHLPLRVRNWAEYNRALIRRGSLTFWVDEQAVREWRDSGSTGPRGGRPRVYSDAAIECTLVVKAVFHLSLRATQGFLDSVVQLMGVDLPVPD